MNVSSEIFQMNISNSADQLFFNQTTYNIDNPAILVAYIMTSVFSGLSNSYVIWLIVMGTGNGPAAELFSLNLSICAILLCVNSFFLVLPNLVQNFFGIFGQELAIAACPLFECLMCVERYLAVVHPVTFLKYKTLRHRVICCTVAWVAFFAYLVVLVLLFLNFENNLLIYVTVAQLILFLSIQLFCLVAVLRALKQSGPGERTREKEENHMKRRAFNVILIITLSMVIIYAFIIISQTVCLNSVNDAQVLFIIANYSTSLGGLVQPFLFLYRVGKPPFNVCQ